MCCAVPHEADSGGVPEDFWVYPADLWHPIGAASAGEVGHHDGDGLLIPEGFTTVCLCQWMILLLLICRFGGIMCGLLDQVVEQRNVLCFGSCPEVGRDELTEDFFNRLELFMAGGERQFMSDSRKMGSPLLLVNLFLFELTRVLYLFCLARNLCAC